MPQHLPSPTRPRLFAGFCTACGRDIEEDQTARTEPALRDVYCAERAGVSVETFRRWRDAALDLYDRDGA